MTSPPSGSNDGPRRSRAFELLPRELQRWIWQQGWGALRQVQESAIPVVLAGDRDVIIAAATAGGKTEAAYLPIFAKLSDEGPSGFRVLSVSPLKALINDQFDRLRDMAAAVSVPVHRWHGDVTQSHRASAVRKPAGALLTTPESLEALFIRRGNSVRRMFSGLEYVVVDELHVFIGTDRGRQLQSLLHRIELLLKRRIPRVALSATIGDLGMAAEALRPGHGDAVERVLSSESGGEVRLQVRGYLDPARMPGAGGHDGPGSSFQGIVEHVYMALRGQRNLVFINQKAEVERHADALRRLAERNRVPNEFFPHHGSLSKGLREDVEGMLKEGDFPITAVCSSTLELGMDIGAVESVAQIGAPPGVASLRQRLGRSGRRGNPATLRVYISEREITSQSSVLDPLRLELFEAAAVVELLIQGWCEPPERAALHLSTLVQQTLSVLAQVGGARPDEVWKALCKTGPFSAVDRPMFARFLRALADHELLNQSSEGLLLPGERGERMVNHYELYSAFTTDEEYRIEHNGRLLGSIPISYALIRGQMLIFSGRRWTVLQVHEEEKRVTVAPAKGGKPPLYAGGGAAVHDRVRQEMLRLYLGCDTPGYLDSGARSLMEQGRTAFRSMGLDSDRFLQDGKDCVVFFWAGDRTVDTILAMLRQKAVRGSAQEGTLTVADTTEQDLLGLFAEFRDSQRIDPLDLAAVVANKRRGKHDWCLSESLLCAEFASRYLDVPSAMDAITGVLTGRTS